MSASDPLHGRTAEQFAAAVAALLSDVYWQLDQFKARGIKREDGQPYRPNYFIRYLNEAEEKGPVAVRDYIRGYAHRRASQGYQALEEADALDLSVEWLIADKTKSYTWLFTDEDRAAARERLATQEEAIRERKAAEGEEVRREAEEHRARVRAIHNENRANQGLPPLTPEQERLLGDDEREPS
jgi:hypothetical protein